MAGQKLSLEEATSARLPFDVAENIDLEEEKETKRKVEEYQRASRRVSTGKSRISKDSGQDGVCTAMY